MLRWLVLIATHLLTLGIGFAIGVYTLPILIAQKGPDAASLQQAAQAAIYKGRFERGLKGSDFLHWGEGEVRLTRDRIAHEGRLAPGPDYKVYLAPEFVDTRDRFLGIKDRSRLIGDVRTFNGFLLPLPAGVDPAAYTAVVVWCEAFGAFITAARYN